MILAAAKCAEDTVNRISEKEERGSPPEALQYAWQAERFNTLPNRGGLRDQPVRLMNEMKVCSNVYTATKAYLSSMSVEWIQRNQDLYGIFCAVQQLKKEMEVE